MKTLVLAAGFGTRLRPFTNSIPKPLCPFFGIPFIDYALFQIEKIKSDVAINTHHLSQKIIDHNDEFYQGLARISHEKTIRGTGGAIYPIKEWIGEEDLLIYNADILSDIDLTELIRQHRKNKSHATMAMLPACPIGKNPVFCDADQVVQIGGQSSFQARSFTGIHIVSRDFIQAIPDEIPWSSIDTYQQLLLSGAKINAFFHHGFWADLGTPIDLWKGHIDLLSAKNSKQLIDSLGIADMRSRRGMAELYFDHTNTSCYSSSCDYTYTPRQSFVDLPEQSIQHQIDQSLLVSSLDSHVVRDIVREVWINEISVEI